METLQKDKVPFEKALVMTGYSRYNWLLFMLCSCIIISTTFKIFSVSYLVPASACELGTSSEVQGLLVYVPIIGAVGTSYLWGFLADTRGRRNILIISLAITYIAGSTAAFSPHWIVFSLFKLVSSAAASGSFALAITLLSECTPKPNRNFMILLTTSIYVTAIGVLAAVTMPILPMTFSYYWPFPGIYFNSWRVLDIIVALPCALSALGCRFVYESPKFLVTVDREGEALEVMKGIYMMNTGLSADNYKVDALELYYEDLSPSLNKGFWDSLVAQTVPLVKPPLLKHTLLLSFLFVICFNTMNAFIAWMPFLGNVFVVAVTNGSRVLTICDMVRFAANTTTAKVINDCPTNSSSMTLLVVFIICMFLAVKNFIPIHMIKSMTRKRLFFMIQMEAGSSAIMILFNSARLMIALMFMSCFSGVYNFAVLITYIIGIFPTSVRAMAVSTIPMIGLGTSVIGINYLKVLLDTNCETAFYVYGFLGLVGALSAFLLPSEEKIREEKDAVRNFLQS